MSCWAGGSPRRPGYGRPGDHGAAFTFSDWTGRGAEVLLLRDCVEIHHAAHEGTRSVVHNSPSSEKEMIQGRERAAALQSVRELWAALRLPRLRQSRRCIPTREIIARFSGISYAQMRLFSSLSHLNGRLGVNFSYPCNANLPICIYVDFIRLCTASLNATCAAGE